MIWAYVAWVLCATLTTGFIVWRIHRNDLSRRQGLDGFIFMVTSLFLLLALGMWPIMLVAVAIVEIIKAKEVRG